MATPQPLGPVIWIGRPLVASKAPMAASRLLFLFPIFHLQTIGRAWKAANSQVKQVCFQGKVWRLKSICFSLLPSKHPNTGFMAAKLNFVHTNRWRPLMYCLPWQDAFKLSLDETVYPKGI